MKTLSTSFRSTASGDSNQPLEIYDLYLDDRTLHVVNYNKNIDFFDIEGNVQTYTAIPVGREAYERTVENPINSIVIGIANVDLSMSSFLASNEFRGRRIIIRKVFADQLTSSGDVSILFDGVMDSPAASEESVQINAVDRIGSLRREVPREWYQLLCNRKFGDEACFYGRTSGDMYSTVKGFTSGGISGDSTALIIKSAYFTQADNYWKDGDLQMTSGVAAIFRRKIISNTQSAKSVNLDISLPSVPNSGDSFNIRRTCDKTAFRCSGDFTNGANFLGFPTIPQSMVVR